MRSNWWGILISVAIVVGCGHRRVWAGTIRADVSDDQYRQLAQAEIYDAVGLVTWFQVDGGYTASSVLVSPEWLLTAAHVVEGTDRKGAGIQNMAVTLNGVRHAADQWIVNPGWDTATGSLSQGVDIGLIHLATPVYDIASAALYTGSSERTQLGTIVGYGTTGTGITGADELSAGTLRAGQNVIDVVQRESRRGTPLLSIDFDNPSQTSDSRFGNRTPVALEYLPAPGDSGGPIYIDVDGQQQVAGIVSYVSSSDQSTNSDYGDMASFTRVSAYISWIDSVVGLIDGRISGDMNNDRLLTLDDFDLLTQSILNLQTDSRFDLNDDRQVNDDDRIYWIEEIRSSLIGDSNLDGSFDSADFVSILQKGQYDDVVVGNSTWASGDWNGDLEFSSADFIYALEHSQFEKSLFASSGSDATDRTASAHQVPEPSSSLPMLVVFATLSRVVRPRLRHSLVTTSR